MKKTLVLFGILAIAPLSVSAYMQSDKTSSVETLKAQGYSESMLQITDRVNVINQGGAVGVNKYTPYYTKRPTKKLGRGYTAIKNYVDPIQEDNQFGLRQINFTNTWNGDETFYSQNLVPKKSQKVENL